LAKPDEFVAAPEEKPRSEFASRTRVPNSDTLAKELDALSDRYENEFKFRPGDPSDPFKCKTIHEMVQCLDQNPNVKLEARVAHIQPTTGNKKIVQMNRESFLRSFKSTEKKFHESFDTGSADSNTGLVGNDFIPILGGPFNKQLYLFDMLDQTQQAFWAYNHDPIAHGIIHIFLDFVMGKGFRVDFDNPHHDALWDAFWSANDMDVQSQQFAKELSMYGENMWWWLPNREININIGRNTDSFPIKKGIIPRIRLMDPSQFWDSITHPEDVNDVLAWQWVTPTQYQMYTGITTGPDAGKHVQGSKFIYQQILAEEIIHTKINCVSNEKRGRSDLFPVLGYLKRLRDTVNYSIIGMQKSAAWSIDTTIEGSMDDLTAYQSDQANLGTIAPAGSEFIHTAKIKREYLSNNATSSGGEPSAFIWCLNMVTAGSRIPISYLGTHLSGGSSRASAVVGTEPVSKLFENRQQTLEVTWRKVIAGLMKRNDITEYNAKFTWPEVITQDRAQKLKDIYLAETAQWISPKRAGQMASKELGQDDWDFEQEQQDIKSEQADEPIQPLTTAGAANPTPPSAGNKPGAPATSGLQLPKPIQKPSGITGNEKARLKSELTK